MDPRRLLILAAAGMLLSGCALLRPVNPAQTARISPGQTPAMAVAEPSPAEREPQTEPEPTAEPVVEDEAGFGARPWPAADAADPPLVTTPPAPSGLTGRRAIAAANETARALSREDGFVGGVQVFAWSPGRVFEVWTAPLRVTTLTLGAGETLVAKAAGDTVRWQIGEAVSGSGAGQRTHVLLKPLERGLETNLVLTTNRRVYLIDLKSGAADAFNTAVAWDAPSFNTVESAAGPPVEDADASGSAGVVMPEGELDGRYRIEPQGRRARWTPTAVFNDGLRTFITFDPDLQVDEAPVLFVIAPDGEAQMVNYRQAGGLYVVDRVFDRAELRLGGRHPQVVRIRRLSGDRS